MTAPRDEFEASLKDMALKYPWGRAAVERCYAAAIERAERAEAIADAAGYLRAWNLACDLNTALRSEVAALMAERDDALDMLGTRDRFNDDAQDALRAEVATLKAERIDIIADLVPLHEAMQASRYTVEAWGQNVCGFAAKELVELRAEVAALKAENYSDLLDQMDEAWGNAREITRAEINAFLESRIVHRPTMRLRAERDALRAACEAVLKSTEYWHGGVGPEDYNAELAALRAALAGDGKP